jgi:hypothetical protein
MVPACIDRAEEAAGTLVRIEDCGLPPGKRTARLIPSLHRPFSGRSVSLGVPTSDLSFWLAIRRVSGGAGLLWSCGHSGDERRTIVGQVDIHRLMFAGWACVPISSSPQAGMQVGWMFAFVIRFSPMLALAVPSCVAKDCRCAIEFPDACQSASLPDCKCAVGSDNLPLSLFGPKRAHRMHLLFPGAG